jgi:uncharacterized protein (TIGR03437 family)
MRRIYWAIVGLLPLLCSAQTTSSFNVTPNSLSINAEVNGPQPVVTVTVHSSVAGTLSIFWSNLVDGLTAQLPTDTSVSAGGNISFTVLANPHGLSAGLYSTIILVRVAGFAAQLPVTMTIAAPGQTFQTISFPALPNQIYGARYSLTATASSGLNVNYSSSTPLVCTVSGNVLSTVGTGICSITASQAGSPNYVAAFDVVQSCTVNKGWSTTSLIRSGGTLLATVTHPGDAPPTGTVQFLNATAVLGTVPLVGSAATLSVSDASAVITAVYSGDHNLGLSASSPLSMTPPSTPTWPTVFYTPTPGSETQQITKGPDGNLWFAEKNGNSIGRITPAGAISEFPIGGGFSSHPVAITVGPDGNLWFVKNAGASSIARITTTGVMTEFSIPTLYHNYQEITTGPDGNLWFTESDGGRIGRMTTAGVGAGEFATSSLNSFPNGIVTATDGNLWFTEFRYGANKIGRLTPGGVLTEFPVPTVNAAPNEITVGPDGNLWFTEQDGNKIGRITTAGVITEFPVPTPNAGLRGITAAPDGNLWFTECGSLGKIGRITTAGVITEFPMPMDNVAPAWIAIGSDGNLWFTDAMYDSNRIWVAPLITTTLVTYSPAVPTYGQSLTLTATVSAGAASPGGTVTFKDTTTNTILATGVTVNGSGQASVTLSTLTAATHLIQATFVPGDTSLASSGTAWVTVMKAPLILTSNNVSKVYGAALPMFSATITGFVNGDTSAVVSGAASLTTAATAASNVGSYPIVIAPGTLAAANYTFGFVNGALFIVRANTTTGLRLSRNTIVATVGVIAPGIGTPTGTVQFLNGSTIAGTVPLTGSTAALDVPPGSYTAVYSGDLNFGGSTSNTVVLYPPGTSSVSLTSSVSPSVLGQAVTFTASVTGDGGPPSAAPSGFVKFLDGAKLLGTASLSGGQAKVSTSALSGGYHPIIAQYSGDSVFPAAEASYPQTVAATVTINLTTTPANAVFGQAVALRATVSATVPPGFAAPTGQVTFQEAGTTLFAPNTTLGMAALVSGNADFTISSLAAGNHTIIAAYSGDAVWQANARSAMVAVSQAATITGTSVSINAAGQVVLTASVAPLDQGNGTPTGNIQFLNAWNNNAVASAALASRKAVVATTVSAVACPIVAVYPGDQNFRGSSSPPLPVPVNAASSLPGSFAADEITGLFSVTGLSGETPATLPLATSLAGVKVRVTDSAGVSRLAQLYGVFASAGQINFVVPGDTAPGTALVTITLPGGGTLTTVVTIAKSAAGIFSANMNGQGVYAGQVVHVHADGSQDIVSSADLGLGGQYAPNPVDLGPPDDLVFLVLYGTGIRHAASLTAKQNGVTLPVLFFGPQGQYAGIDQINIALPRSLAGAGLVSIIVSADGQAANPVTVAIQ